MSGYQRSFAGKGYRRSAFGRSYYGRRWGSVYRKSLGAARAAKTGNKIAYWSGQINGAMPFVIPAGEYYSDVCMICPFTGAYTMSGSGSSAKYTPNEGKKEHGGVLMDRGFRLMCAQYDQCRLTKMTVKLNTGQIVNQYLTGLKFHSVIDRNFTKKELDAQQSGAMTDEEQIDYVSIINNPGEVTSIWNYNSVGTMNRYCSPSNLKEKEAWTDASIAYTANAGYSPLTQMYNRGWYDGLCDFAPCFMYCMQINQTSQAQSTTPVSYTVEYTFAFRNPRSGLDKFIAVEAIGFVNPSGAKGVLLEPKREEEDDEVEVDDPDPKS